MAQDTFGFRPRRPPKWDIERFMRGDEAGTAGITLERIRLTRARRCANVPVEGMVCRLVRRR
jgi:hypothetical protein